MGSSELYNLRWNDFQSCLSSSVSDLLEESDFTDVTLACSDGQNFAVHKIVLSACSQYFKKVLKRNPCQHPVIILKDVPANILNSIIAFIYHGAADVPQDSINEFLKTAQSLEIKGLAEDNNDNINKSQIGSRDTQGHLGQSPLRNIQKKRFSPYPVPEKRSAEKLAVPALVKQDHSSTTQDVMSRLQKRDLSIFRTGASSSQDASAFSHDDSNSSANRFSQDVNDKNDPEVSIVNIKNESDEVVMEDKSKEEASGSASYFLNLIEDRKDSEVSIVNIKEESEVILPDTVSDNAETSEHFMMDDASQAEYLEEEYDESYYEGYDDSQGGMMQEYEGGSSSVRCSTSFPCPSCGRSYKHARGLSQHMKYECGKGPQFSCPYCPQKCAQKGGLKRHCLKQHGQLLDRTVRRSLDACS